MPSPSGPFPAVLCPSIGRPGGTGVGRLGCRVAATGLLSALPRHSSCSIIPIPMPSSSPISIPGAAVGNISLVLVAKDALELAPLPSPASTAFCSWCCRPRGHDVRSSPSPISFALWRVTLSVGVHSVCAPVSKSGGLTGLLRSPGSVHSSGGSSASRPFLRFLLRDTVYQFQALCFGLSTAPPVFTWVMAPVSALLHSLGICMRRYLDTWLVQSSSQESLLEVLLPVLRLCPVLGLSSIPGIPTSYLPRWCCVCGSSSIPPLSGLLRRWNASLGGNLQPPYLCHAPRLPRACGCRF